MLRPALLECRVRRHVGVVGIVAGDVLAVGADAIARVGKPLPIVAGLRAVFGDGKTCELAAIGAEFSDPIDHRNRQHRLRVGSFRIDNESIATLAGDSAGSAMLW